MESFPELKATYDAHATVLTKHDWDTVFLSNHDNPRIVSTFGDDSPAMRVPSAKLFETMRFAAPSASLSSISMATTSEKLLAKQVARRLPEEKPDVLPREATYDARLQ
jgi:hypothetical protein